MIELRTPADRHVAVAAAACHQVGAAGAVSANT